MSFTANRFVIWYESTVKVGHTPEDWTRLPDDGVVAIYEFFGLGADGIPRAMSHSGSDWYWMNSDGTRISANGESTMLFGQWVNHNAPQNAVLKRGRWVSQERLDEVTQQLQEMILGVT